MIDPIKSHAKIVFFDGVCNLCNNSIDYIIRHNKEQDLHFCSLQSNFAKSFLSDYEIDTEKLSSLIYYENSSISIEADAVFQICKNLSGLPAKIIRIASILPSWITSRLYRFTAKKRYSIWGKRSTCRIPSKEETNRFIA